MQALMLLLASLSVVPAGTEPLPVLWAPRLEGGAISVLFVAPAFGVRDVDEIARRLEIKAQTVTDLSDLPSVLSRDFDVVAIGNMSLAEMSEGLVETLKARVNEGKGLVIANHRDAVPSQLAEFLANKQQAESAADIKRGVGESMTTEWPSNLDFVTAGTAGKGRVVELDYPGEKPLCHSLLPGLTDPLRARPEYADVYLSLICRAIRWAAGRRPAIAVASIEDSSPVGPTEDQIPPGMPEEYVQQIKDGVAKPLFKPYLIRFEKPADRPYRVYAQVRESNRQLQVEYPDLAPLAEGQSSYLLEVPLGPGRYFLDLWFYDKKDVAEWHTANLTVTGWPEITEVNWSKGNLLPNDRLMISLNIRPQFNQPRGCTVFARATDALGRVVAENSVPVGVDGGPAAVPLNFADLLSNFVKVEVFAADVEGRPLSSWDLNLAAYSHLYMPVRVSRPQVCSMTVEAPAVAEYNARAWLRELVGAGVDSVYTTSSEDSRFHLAELNLRAVPDLLEGFPQDLSTEISDPLNETIPAYWAAGTTTYMLGNAAELTSATKSARAAIRAIDKDAAVGIVVNGKPDAPVNWHGLATGLDFLAVPDEGAALAKLRSYRTAGLAAELVVDKDPSAWHAWRQAVYQMQGIWLKDAAGEGFSELAAAVRELRSGVGFLLAHSVRQPQVALVDAGQPQAESALAHLLSSRGYEFDFVTLDVAKTGGLGRYKMAILPVAEAGKDLDSQIKESESSGGKVATFSGGAGANLDFGGLAPAVAVEGAGAEAYAFAFGNAKVYAFLANPGAGMKGQKVSFKLAGEAHVYDVRRAKYLGKTDKVSATVADDAAAVFSVLPYRIKGLEVTTLEAARRGRRLPLSLVVGTKGAEAGMHVVHIEFGPVDRPPLAHYAQDVVCQSGQAATFIPLALNDQPGLYTLTVRDVLSGVSKETRVTLE